MSDLSWVLLMAALVPMPLTWWLVPGTVSEPTRRMIRILGLLLTSLFLLAFLVSLFLLVDYF